MPLGYRLLLGAAVALAFSGLGVAAPGPAVGLRLAFEPASLDWTLGDVPIHVINNTVEGLYTIDPSGSIASNEAEALPQAGKSAGSWLIRLRKGLLWSDGRAVAASDYVDAWSRLRDPRTGSTYSYLLAELESFRAVSKTELEVRLRDHGAKRFPVSVLTHWTTFPVRSDLLKAHPKEWGANPKAMAFNGPYKIESYEHESRLVLVPNTRHRAPGTLSRIEALIVPDDATAVRLYESGRIHFLPEINTLERTALTSRSDYHTMRSPILTYLGIDVTHPAFRSKEARRALSLAIDRTALPGLLAMSCIPTTELVPEGETPAAGADAAAARAAGPSLNKQLLEFGYYEKGLNRALAEFLQNQWRENLGLLASLHPNEVKSYWTKLAEKPYPFFLNSYSPPVPDPIFYFRLLVRGNPMNMGRWQDNAYDAAVAREDFSAARAILHDQTPIVPLYFRVYDYLLSPRLEGVSLNPMASLDLGKARLTEKP